MNLEQALASILNGGDITIDWTDVDAFNEFTGKYNRKYGIRCHLNQVTNKARIQKRDNTPIEGFVPSEPSVPPAPPSTPEPEPQNLVNE